MIKHYEICFDMLKDLFYEKRVALYSLHIQVLTVVAVVTLYNYIRQEARRDYLFEKIATTI